MRFTRRKKMIAVFFLIVFTAQLLLPNVSYALTSGPSQPEMAKFEPAGTSDMVDLFSGDMKYNIPLMDVGGYPINISYQSGTGMEDEASWVGTGWTLNPGAMNRNMRGLPDDFDGTKGDKIRKEYSKKEFRKVGASFVIKPSLWGWEQGKASIKMNVYKDNYYGIGASFGASLSYNIGLNQAKTGLTAALGLDVNSDTRDGLDISPSLGLERVREFSDVTLSGGLSGGFQYNTRAGLKSYSLESFSTSRYKGVNSTPKNIAFSGVHYLGQDYTPTIYSNISNESYSLSLDGGASFFGVYTGIGGSGSYFKENIDQPLLSVPAFGFLNYVKGRKDKGALLDFNREKDGIFLPSAPSIPIPIATNDFFTATSQTGSQQFRPYYGSNYVVFDQAHENKSRQASAGATIGGGNIFKGGGRIEYTIGSSKTNKWTDNNNYLDLAEPTFNGNDPFEEPVYFKQVGEPVKTDNSFFEKIGGLKAGKIMIAGSFGTSNKMRTRDEVLTLPGEMKKSDREKKVYGFSYLDTKQAIKYGLNRELTEDLRNEDDYRSDHHISEITVTDDAGKRMIYGIPVYNRHQEEVTFSVNPPAAGIDKEIARRSGLIVYANDPFSPDKPFYKNGRDQFFSRETTPAYSTSFLLTGILSPDYVDLKKDGITDDDLGTAIAFKYDRHTKEYKWRAPLQDHKANYNAGLLSDPKDDKASFVYGQKEIWYLDAIESKTMIAVFKTSVRDDGLGVNGRDGGINNDIKLKKLDKIILYSKADWLKNGESATPIKTVNFEYDYSLYPETVNSINPTGGKLTLKKIYFTFGKSQRGVSNPYEFSYLTTTNNRINDGTIPNLAEPIPPSLSSAEPLFKEKNEFYTERQSDRWGTYKQSWYNHLTGSSSNSNSTVDNSEFPYALQKNSPPPNVNKADWEKLIDRMASQWQLYKIVTPSSGIITVSYESDDYAYVQNRKAQQMFFLKGINTEGQSTGLINADKVVVDLPVPVTNFVQFKELYLKQPDGKYVDKLFYKVYTDMDNRHLPYASKHWEYVNGYAEIDETNSSASGTTAYIALKKIGGYNPIAKAAWQKVRVDLPQYAYDGYDNSEVENNVVAAVKSLILAVGNIIRELESFEKKATKRSYGDRVELSKSMIRLNTPSDPGVRKTGGGVRVKKVEITDEWSSMSNVSGSITSKYGQVYDYAIRNKNGEFISSSGVASYEPQIGNEENPFHEPEGFVEKVHWGSDKYHFIEKPYCESYFPAPSVGYSKVKVTAFGSDYQGTGDPATHTGYIENEFYTAKDFPTVVEKLTLDKPEYENHILIKLFSSTSVRKMVTTQGFSIELNDMHAKPKGVKIYNKGGDLISSTEYFYNLKDDNAEFKELKNDVPVLTEDGTIISGPNITIGEEVDFVTDVRESISENIGRTIGAYTGGMLLPIPPFFPYIPYVAVIPNPSITKINYHSISTVKVINRFGIVKKVVTTQNGSTIEAENLLWSGETGEVLLTRTQNEFDKSTFAFSYPAYMVNDYEGMGGAYHNLGAVFSDFETGVDGDVSAYSTYLFPGDELIALDTDEKGWIIKSSGNTLRLVDANGEFIASSGDWQILRSGKRNMLTASVGSVITMNDPRVGNQIVLDVNKRVLDSKAMEFKDEWAVPVNDISSTSTVTGRWVCHLDYWKAFTQSLFEINPSTGKRYLFSFINDNVTVGDIIRVGIQQGHFDPQSTPLIDFFYACTPGAAPNVDQTYYYLEYKRETTPPSGYYLILPTDKAYFATASGHKVCTIDFPIFNTAAEHFLNDESIQPINESWGGSTCDKQATYSIPPSSPSYSYCSGSRVITNATQLLKSNNNSDTVHYNHNKNSARTGSTLSAPCEFKMHIEGSHIADGAIFCLDPANKIINPYYKGILGNWRPVMNYAYTVAREQKPGNINQVGGTDIRNSGYYAAYSSFWNWQGGALARTFTNNQTLPLSDPRSRWIWSNRSVYYDQKGNEIESVDALNRYGAALFGYKQSVATAVGANARNNEIAFDGYEDYDFDLGTVSSELCPLKRHLDFGFADQNGTWTSPGGTISAEQSHTGKYSYRLNGTTTINKPAGNAAPPISSILSYDGSGRYLLNSNELANGFAPVNGKKYLFSCWVYDESPTTNTLNGVTITVNGVSPTSVTVVEGWKRVEIPFIASSNFNLVITGSGKFIDDLRIFPNEGQMNSYVYDNRTMRLMAQLDENNFATLYEYDDEGTPVRVKKETERGLMTLKENRQSLRKRN